MSVPVSGHEQGNLKRKEKDGILLLYVLRVIIVILLYLLCGPCTYGTTTAK